MKIFHLALVSLGVVMLVAGCGGGGGGGGGITIPTGLVQITTTNAPDVAKGAVIPAQSMTQTGSSMAGVIGVVAQTSGHTRSVLDISLAEFNRARSLKFPPVVAGVIQSVTLDCTIDGTVTGSIQDLDSSNTFTFGDILTMAFHNCVEPDPVTGSSTMNGSATFAIISASGNLGTVIPPFSAEFTLTFSNFTSRDNVTNLTESINGDIGFSFTDDGTDTTGTMSGQSITLISSVDGGFLMTAYSISFTAANLPSDSTPYSFSVDMTIASTVANGSVTIATITPFTGVGIDDPTAGAMLITGKNDSTLTLTTNADGIHVGIVVDEDGAGGVAVPVTITNPATPGIDYTWADL